MPGDEEVGYALYSLWHHQGEIYLANNQVERALKAFKAAQQFDPENQALAEQIEALQERLRLSEDVRLQRALIQQGILERQLKEEREAREQLEQHMRSGLWGVLGVAGLAVVVGLVPGLPSSVRFVLMLGLLSALVFIYRWLTHGGVIEG